MKNQISYIVIAIIILISNSMDAQISSEFFGTKDDFKALVKRILIVETLVENQEVMSKLSKKENGRKLIEDYKKFIQKYNEYIQITTFKHWKLNDSIEFRNENEVAQLKKTGKKNYALLSYMELKEEGDSHQASLYSIPAIKYTRIETPDNEPDYKIYIPSSFLRSSKKYIEADFRVAIMAMQENIKYIVKTKEPIEFQEFILDMADKNCKKLKRSTVLIERNMLPKEITEDWVKSHCKVKVEFVSVEEIENHMFYKTKGKSAVIAFPFAILHGKNGKEDIASIVYFKIAMDCETGNIIWTNGGSLGHISYDNNHSQFMSERDFKNMEPCE